MLRASSTSLIRSTWPVNSAGEAERLALYSRVLRAAEGLPRDVERDGQVGRLLVAQHVDQHRGEPVDRVGVLPGRGREVLDRQREEGPVGHRMTVDQQQGAGPVGGQRWLGSSQSGTLCLPAPRRPCRCAKVGRHERCPIGSTACAALWTTRWAWSCSRSPPPERSAAARWRATPSRSGCGTAGRPVCVAESLASLAAAAEVGPGRGRHRRRHQRHPPAPGARGLGHRDRHRHPDRGHAGDLRRLADRRRRTADLRRPDHGLPQARQAWTRETSLVRQRAARRRLRPQRRYFLAAWAFRRPWSGR